MSLRADKGDAQLRKPGRSGSSGHHHRGYSGGGKGSGGGGPAPPPPPLSSSAAPAAPSLSTNRSFKKWSNGQGAQTQAMLHQGQGLGFAPQMSHQLTPQIGNKGIGIGSQFLQQQLGKFSGPRKTAVKIIHPVTHEELRIDKRTDSYMDGSTPGQRMLPNVTPQSQPIPTFSPSHQLNFYSQLQQNTYSAPPMFFPTFLPLSSTQMTTGSQAP